MFDGIRASLRARYLLPERFTVRDLAASLRTKPVAIETFSVAGESPYDRIPHLAELAAQQEGQPFLKWWQYFDAYDRELADLALRSRQGELARPLRVLEIGVWRGGSLGLWRDYFGDDAVIYGVDIDPQSATFGVSDGVIRIGSQTDERFMAGVVGEMGGIDVVIDDGSHVSADVLATLDMLWPHLADPGVYIVEDLHTSYWPAWGGGLRRHDSSIEGLKRLVDVIHAPYFSASADRRADAFAGTLESVSFYDSVAVLRKRARGGPRPFRGGRSD